MSLVTTGMGGGDKPPFLKSRDLQGKTCIIARTTGPLVQIKGRKGDYFDAREGVVTIFGSIGELQAGQPSIVESPVTFGDSAVGKRVMSQPGQDLLFRVESKPTDQGTAIIPADCDPQIVELAVKWYESHQSAAPQAADPVDDGLLDF